MKKIIAAALTAALLSACMGKPAPAPTSSTALSASAPALAAASPTTKVTDTTQSAWMEVNQTDPITDRKSYGLGNISAEVGLVMTIACARLPGGLRVAVSGDKLSSFGDDDYTVSYRFDQKPGVSDQHWNGSRNGAWPKDADNAQFIQDLVHSQKLLIVVHSSMMSDSEYQHFDLHGAEAAFAKLRQRCASTSLP